MLKFSKAKYVKSMGVSILEIPEWVKALDGTEINELRNKGYTIKAEWCEDIWQELNTSLFGLRLMDKFQVYDTQPIFIQIAQYDGDLMEIQLWNYYEIGDGENGDS